MYDLHLQIFQLSSVKNDIIGKQKQKLFLT